MSFVDEPMYPVKKLYESKMYIISIASSTIALSAAYMILWLSCMQQNYECSSRSCERTNVIDFSGICIVPLGSTDAL